jgi:hypothetical protein
MLTMDGWDVMSLTDVTLVNAALAARGNELITEFDYREDGLRLSGRFGAWQIAPGGSMNLLFVDIPIATGKLAGLPGRVGPVNVAGLTLRVRLMLGLLPAEGAPDQNDLRFDFEASEAAGKGVLPLDILDPKGQLSAIEASMLKSAAAACLAAHGDQVTFVFASVKARGTVSTDWLDLPHHDWANVVTADGRQYLAIAGALSPPKARLQTIDPALVATPASAYVALSNRLLAERVLRPSIKTSFKPPTPFALKGTTLTSQRRIPLGVKKHGIWTIEPFIDRLSIAPAQKGLHIAAESSADLPMWSRLVSHLTLDMPFAYDAAGPSVAFRPDPKPKERHEVKCPPVLDILIGWLIRLIVSANEGALRALVHGVAGRMQMLNTKRVSAANWRGIRDFQLGAARMDGCMVLADTRPA